MLSSHRGVIDIILGDVLVVFARFLATAVVTLRCSKLSDMAIVPSYRLRMVVICVDLDSGPVNETGALSTGIVVVIADFDVLQDTQRVVGEHGAGEIER